MIKNEIIYNSMGNFNYWQPYIIPTAQKIDELPKDLRGIEISSIISKKLNLKS